MKPRATGAGTAKQIKDAGWWCHRIDINDWEVDAVIAAAARYD
jgi:hypothetical protein